MLPRMPTEAGIVSVKLKRKLEYKGSYIEQIIDSRRIFKFLAHLKSAGHPEYQFYDDKNKFEDRCEREDPEGFLLLYPEYDLLEEQK